MLEARGPLGYASQSPPPAPGGQLRSLMSKGQIHASVRRAVDRPQRAGLKPTHLQGPGAAPGVEQAFTLNLRAIEPAAARMSFKTNGQAQPRLEDAESTADRLFRERNQRPGGSVERLLTEAQREAASNSVTHARPRGLFSPPPDPIVANSPALESGNRPAFVDMPYPASPTYGHAKHGSQASLVSSNQEFRGRYWREHRLKG